MPKSKVIDNAGFDFTAPAWVINMAGEYAEANGVAEISVTEFFKTSAYRDQARRNVRTAENVGDADFAANR